MIECICNQICNHLLLLNKLSISLHFFSFLFFFLLLFHFMIGSVSWAIARVCAHIHVKVLCAVNGFFFFIRFHVCVSLRGHAIEAGENFLALIYHKLYQIITALCRWCISCCFWATHHRNYRWNTKIVYISVAMKVLLDRRLLLTCTILSCVRCAMRAAGVYIQTMYMWIRPLSFFII